MNRGARREPIFVDDDSRALFLEVLAELPERFGVRVHGYALMPNHYHLLLESVTGGLARAMRHLGGEYTRRLNRMHAWDGPLFRGRYHNRLVGTDAYWRHLLVYVHLNPVRAGLPDGDGWTSHAAYLGLAPRPPWLTTAELQDAFGGPGAYLDHSRRVADGRLKPPEDFDEKQLWAPHSTGSVAVPDLVDPTFDLADALAEVSAVTGLSLADVLAAPVGRHGNPANWLAAWWLSRGCGIPHGSIAAALGVSHTVVSKRIRRVEERRGTDGQLATWAAALGKGERGNT